MPTTIFDSSLITQRNRDKVIAQSVKQRNAAGVPIITPQAGYASYTIEDVDNGEITAFRKVGQCTNINPACTCIQVTATNEVVCTPNNVYTPGDYEISTIINPNSLQIHIVLGTNDSATIYWGDGTNDIITGPDITDTIHTYPCAANYIISIQGSLTNLILSDLFWYEAGGEPPYFPSVNTVTINNNGQSLQIIRTDGNIIGLEKCINLTELGLGISSTDLAPLYTNNIISLTSLTLIRYSGPTSITPFNNQFPNLTTILITGPSYEYGPFNGITTLYDSSPMLDTINFAYTSIQTLPTLPSTVRSLIIDTTLINLATVLPVLSTLSSLEELSAGTLVNTNFTTYSLSNLPPLLNLSINDNPTITDLAALDVSLINILSAGGCNITQSAADNLATRLVTAGTLNGTLIISEQSTGTLTITGGPWNTLLSRNWTIR
jgi:hypothetical protein